MYRTDEITDYVFNNTQPLSHNISFVKKHLVGGKNQAIDEPESVLDAMAQASECPQIGWDRSDDVMRLMIVITETGSKRSRHGDIIGIINPNDGECKMDDLSLLETMDTDYIHPHILGESLSRNAIRVLTESFRHQVMGIKDFNKITGTSLISIIENSVQQARTIKFNIEFMMSELQVQHTLTCPSSKNAVTNALECPTVDIDQIAKLSLTINYNKRVCLAHNVNKHNATMNTYVKVNGFYHFSINATFQCMCSCSNAQMTDESQRACSGNGTLVCGKCKCDTGLEGDTCQCQKGKQPALDDEPECKKDIDCGENALHGKCVCGKCVCLSRSNLSLYSKRILYSFDFIFGNSRGSCVCGKCICDENYIGNDCSVLSCDNSLKEDECKRTTELPVMEFAIVGSVHANLDTLENIANRLKYCLINFSAPEVRCSHTWDCMTYIMASKKKEGCNISVKFVEKIDELFILSYLFGDNQWLYDNVHDKHQQTRFRRRPHNCKKSEH
ncbi:Integrin beta-2 [Thelohanellus kitauei]|uniref:Integrin beta-2 n=1 Tax=Thelohanellus kitauei TaxID=669202 RepID=A0A0C2IMW7_THEKT|nr:Integrin beta-2 [Thelohanellus kitauei]